MFRVYELARELGMKNKSLIFQLRDMNIGVKSHMSSLDGETVTKIKENIRKNMKTTHIRLGKPSRNRISQQTEKSIQPKVVSKSKVHKAKIIKKAPEDTQEQLIRDDSDKSKQIQKTTVPQNLKEKHQALIRLLRKRISQQEFKLFRTQTLIEHEISALRSWLNKKEHLNNETDILNFKMNELRLEKEKLNQEIIEKQKELSEINADKLKLRLEIEKLNQEIRGKQKKLSEINSDKLKLSDLPDFMKGI